VNITVHDLQTPDYLFSR